MSHPADADELFEVSGNELGTIVADDPRMNARVALTSPLDDRFDVALFHLGANFPVHDRSAEATEQAAKEEEGSPDVDIGPDVDNRRCRRANSRAARAADGIPFP